MFQHFQPAQWIDINRFAFYSKYLQQQLQLKALNYICLKLMTNCFQKKTVHVIF